jgi:hypothetical protein
VERGNHESLLAEDGLYASLCKEAEAHHGVFGESRNDISRGDAENAEEI